MYGRGETQEEATWFQPSLEEFSKIPSDSSHGGVEVYIIPFQPSLEEFSKILIAMFHQPIKTKQCFNPLLRNSLRFHQRATIHKRATLEGFNPLLRNSLRFSISL